MNHRVRTAIHLTLVLAVALSAAAFFIPTEAKAGCFYPKRTVVKYYGWYTNNGQDVICEMCCIGPYIPPTVVGEHITECDGTTWSWGFTHCSITETTRTICPDPICD